MAENVMNNVSGIEIGSLVIDNPEPTNCIMIQTRRNRYCFRLSESFPIEKQYEIFRKFVVDVNTPIKTASQEAPAEAKPVEETPTVEIATQD